MAEAEHKIPEHSIGSAPKDRIIEISPDGKNWTVSRWLTTRHREHGTVVWASISFWTKGCFPGDREPVGFKPTKWRELAKR